MHAHHNAHGAGIAAPEPRQGDPGGLSQIPKEKARLQPGSFGEQLKTDSANSIVTGSNEQADNDLATLRAQLAIAGWTVRIVDGAFTVSRWGHTRTLAGREQLRQFALQIGVGQ